MMVTGVRLKISTSKALATLLAFTSFGTLETPVELCAWGKAIP